MLCSMCSLTNPEWIGRITSLPSAGCTAANLTVQYATGHLPGQDIQFDVYQVLFIIFWKTAFHTDGTQLCCCSYTFPEAFELNEVPVSSLLQPLEVLLNNNPTLQYVSISPQLGILCELAENALHPVTQVTN